MKTRNASLSSSLILHFLTSGVSIPQSIWAMLVGAFVYRCATIAVLGSTLALNAAAQSEVPTTKPKIKLIFQLADLWVPYGTTCIFYNMPNYNSTTGIFSVAVGNKGNASAPSSSLKVMEYRAGPATEGGEEWMHFKDYSATAPPLAPGEQKLISVKVAKFTPPSDPEGHPKQHPNKRPRKWIFKADGKNQIPEANEGNNGLEWKTLN